MALFEPTQIIPSTNTNSGTIAAENPIRFQWQVNGNSSLHAYQIDIFLRDAESTFLHSTGRIDLEKPFLGLDRYGNRVYFTCEPQAASWGDIGVEDGQDYKFKITQWYAANREIIYITPTTLATGTTYYFSYGGKYYSFVLLSEGLKGASRVCFDLTEGIGWLEVPTSSSNQRYITITIAQSNNIPSGEPTNLGSATLSKVGDKDFGLAFVQQISESAVTARSAPTLKITEINGEPIGEKPQITISSSIVEISATYEQKQDDPIRWISWQITNANSPNSPLNDTAEFYTPVTDFTYDGLFNGETYIVQCVIETEVGAQVSAETRFSVKYQENTYLGSFTAQCYSSENSVLLVWEAVTAIPATNQGEYRLTQNGCELSANAKITWDKEGTGEVQKSINFDPAWVVVWKGNASVLGEFLSLNAGGINAAKRGDEISVEIQGSKAKLSLYTGADKFALYIAQNAIYLYSYQGGDLLGVSQQFIKYEQSPISTISILGGDGGATVDCLSVYRGDGNEILPLLNDVSFKPTWSSELYSLYMTANFERNIDGGTGTSSIGNGFRIYRREEGSNELKVIENIGSDITRMKDFGIVSGKTYTYYLYAYDSNQAFMSQVVAPGDVSTRFKHFSLLVAKYNETDGAYHVRKQFIFEANLSESDVSNNNEPTFQENFTKYPTYFPTTQNHASGVLQSLIGTIDATANEYYDSIELQRELDNLSTTKHSLFLRDMKGHIRMVKISGPITQNTNYKTLKMQNTISLPWREVGSAEDVPVIQLPTDVGWAIDEYVLDVRLDVDVETGMLYAYYNIPYNGTRFSLSGNSQQNLIATTPSVLALPKFELPAEETPNDPTNDGMLTVAVLRNTDEDSEDE